MNFTGASQWLLTTLPGFVILSLAIIYIAPLLRSLASKIFLHWLPGRVTTHKEFIAGVRLVTAAMLRDNDVSIVVLLSLPVTAMIMSGFLITMGFTGMMFSGIEARLNISGWQAHFLLGIIIFGAAIIGLVSSFGLYGAMMDGAGDRSDSLLKAAQEKNKALREENKVLRGELGDSQGPNP